MKDYKMVGGEMEQPVRGRRFGPGSQSAVLRTGPGSWVDRQILRPRPKLRSPGAGPATRVLSSPIGGSDVCLGLRTLVDEGEQRPLH